MSIPAPAPLTPPDPERPVDIDDERLRPPADAVADPTGEGGRRPLDPSMAAAEDPEATTSEEAMEQAIAEGGEP